MSLRADPLALGTCNQASCSRLAVARVFIRNRPAESLCGPHAVLRRAGWRCEALMEDRLHPGKMRRCPVVGSEVWVLGGEARCPRHAVTLCRDCNTRPVSDFNPARKGGRCEGCHTVLEERSRDWEDHDEGEGW